MNRLFKENGEKVFLTDEVVGGGAESDIYNIHGDSKIVAKKLLRLRKKKKN